MSLVRLPKRQQLALILALQVLMPSCHAEEHTASQPASREMVGIFIKGVPLAKLRGIEWPPPYIANYEAAASKFPSSEACLQPHNHNRLVRSINWQKISSQYEATVCLSRAVSPLGNAEAISDWLKAQGFTVVSIRSAEKFDTFEEAAERSGKVIDASWSIKDRGPLFRGSIVSSMRQRFFAHAAYITVFVSSTGRVVSPDCKITFH